MISDKEKIDYNELVLKRCSRVAVQELTEKLWEGSHVFARYEFYNEKLYCRWAGCQAMTNRAFVIPFESDSTILQPYCNKHMTEYRIGSKLEAAKIESHRL